MTSNPMSRRPEPSPDPLPLTSYFNQQILAEIDRRIALHERRVALISTLIGTPLLLINLLLFIDLYRKF
jgi:hypothetical protein